MSGPGQAAHWQSVYETRPGDTVSWHQGEARVSLDAIGRTGLGAGSAVIDIGGGASTLVDGLLAQGFGDVTVLDIADAGMAVARSRLGEAVAARVGWIVADITRWTPPRAYDIWHDRAVFHFLTGAEERAAYTRALDAGLSRDCQVIIATFALDGPERCSGLPTCRYGAAELAAAFGSGFRLLESWPQLHHTPAGHAQPFTWCRFARAG